MLSAGTEKALNKYHHTVITSIILKIFIFFFSYFIISLATTLAILLNADFILIYTYSMEKVSSKFQVLV